MTQTSVRFYVAAHGCGHFTVKAWRGGMQVDDFPPPQRCAQSAGQWFSYGDIPLYASRLSGGITEAMIDAYDDTHQGSGWADCTRAASSCSTWPRCREVSPGRLRGDRGRRSGSRRPRPIPGKREARVSRPR